MTADDLRMQDEILQVLYWMRGERLGDAASAEEVGRFLPVPVGAIARALEQLADRGLVEPAGDVRLRLTAAGLVEGKRRFQDEFAPFLGKESHLVCSDPACDCHAAGWDGDCTSAR